MKSAIFSLLLLKSEIVGTRLNRLIITYNICFRAKLRKNNGYGTPCKPKFNYIKVGYTRIFHGHVSMMA